ncbi:MAG: Crp/Fnr family transcriptional regulator [Hyphomicrobium sp.]|uniref:Crp/Fnr family transcriptional regulator n=1 Tax=Hyphomicrobium sp. TaxID=82 RepID=UPI0013250B1B|nr:Crp/Fnr family transcriptional regulator [Hyphomicrobium sp.]KAB2940770.1 MAG: Crp/Fnr family transcriptional regulator [Hyphomicrobium sp.]MBZ0211339.1 Crp/Fnr family transcriptional regulator [Hyphomicrobium sp.]
MAWLSLVGVSGKGGHPSPIEPAFSNSPVAAPPAETTAAPQQIAANAFIFRAGDPRTHLYRVESGAICLYETGRSDRQSIIEFLFPGDYAGLGFLQKHHLSARALLDSSVTCHPLDALPDLVKNDPRAQAMLAHSVEREFEARRDELCSAGRRRPIERVAALLVTSARTNVQQGRPAAIIKDSWKCGFIADLLQLTLDDLAALLVELERRGLIAAAGKDLRLLDIPALEAMADGIWPNNDHGAARSPQLLPAHRAA